MSFREESDQCQAVLELAYSLEPSERCSVCIDLVAWLNPLAQVGIAEQVLDELLANEEFCRHGDLELLNAIRYCAELLEEARAATGASGR